jgi:hypothetical protein
MKIKQLVLLVALGFLCMNSNAQIKVFSGGSVTIGATTSPTANAVMHQIIGGKVVFPASTSAITSAPLINGTNGYSSASAPDFTWLGDVQTGFFHRAASEVNLTINNSEKFRFNSGGQILNANGSSSESTPDYSWSSNSNTGMFRYGSDMIAFSTGGTERFRINSNGQLLSKHGPNTAANPDFSWENDPNTGLFWVSADIMGFSSNGAERMRINNAGNVLMGTTTQSNGERVVITGASNQQPLSVYASYPTDGGYGEIIWVNQNHTKAFSIISSASGSNVENFFVHGTGDAWGKSWTSWSDRTLKENIDSIPDALNKVKQLKGVTYNFKSSIVGSDDAAKKEMGLIAQDVEKIIPEVVKTSDNGIKGITYSNLVALLVEAIKEQDKQISQLQSDVNNCCAKTGATPQQNRVITTPNENTGESYKGDSYIKQNVPNPFNKETNIEYFIAEKNPDASILVFDMNGKLLKTYKLQPGKNSLLINGNELSPGMYYYSLVVNNKEVGTKKMILTE